MSSSGASDSDADDDDSDTSMTLLGRSAEHRNRRRHDATYGVFWEEDNDTEQQPLGGNKSVNGRKRKRRGDKQNGGMLFVKGSTTEEAKHDEQSSTNAAVTAAVAQSVEVAPTVNEETEAQTPDPEAEKANQYFLSLLAKGKGRPSSTGMSLSKPSSSAPSRVEDVPARGGLGYQAGDAEDEDEDADDEEYDEDPQPAGLGLGFNRNSAGIGNDSWSQRETPTSFGRSRRTHEGETRSKSRPDPNVGQWEKHTKGIGMKLLSKMGYKGSGGLRANSVAAPVPVKVRPTNLGLGFGNFKEATSKQPVAPPPKPVAAAKGSRSSSALPSANDIMQQKTWKKRRDKKKGSRADFVAYTDLLDSRRKGGEAMTVIDMTGSASKGVDDNSPVPLGQEMLHNISIMLGTFENRLHSESSFVQTHKRQQETFQADLEALKEQQEELKQKERKLQTVLELLDQMEAVLTDASLNFAAKLDTAQSILCRLADNFSAAERLQIQFAETIIPALLGAVVQPELDAWDPMQYYPNIPLLRGVLQCTTPMSGRSDDSATDATMIPPYRDNLVEIRKTLLLRHLIPKLKRTWQSSRWDPTVDVSAVEIVESLVTILKEIEPKPTLLGEESVLFSDHERQRTELRDIVRDELIDGVVVKRLVQTLGYWDGLQLDQWVMPWLPFVAPGNVPTLVAECKRKIKTIMTKSELVSIQDNCEFFNRSVEILVPWKGFLKKESLENITSEHVAPRLARHLSKCNVANADEASAVLFAMHDHGLLSDRLFLSLLESELLANVAKTTLSWKGKPGGAGKIVNCYCSWKQTCFGSSESRRVLLSNDQGVCRALYAVLLTSATTGKETDPAFSFRSTNYRTTLHRRKKQAKRTADDDIVREMEPNPVAAEARVKLGGGMPTFRQVVEQLATTNGLLLIPKAGRRVDGRQTFELGGVSVYFDENIVYALEETRWNPVSLEALIKRALST